MAIGHLKDINLETGECTLVTSVPPFVERRGRIGVLSGGALRYEEPTRHEQQAADAPVGPDALSAPDQPPPVPPAIARLLQLAMNNGKSLEEIAEDVAEGVPGADPGVEVGGTTGYAPAGDSGAQTGGTLTVPATAVDVKAAEAVEEEPELSEEEQAALDEQARVETEKAIAAQRAAEAKAADQHDGEVKQQATRRRRRSPAS